MPRKKDLRKVICDKQDEIAALINAALRGNRRRLKEIEPVLKRVGRGGQLPHWYEKLKSDGALPNLDGKTIGSVVEMLLVGVLETMTFKGMDVPPLRINPARGVDIPYLELGVKSPSRNFCTSEPFFSAYERLLGSECDIWVLLTDYQDKKKTPPLRLQITDWRYLTKSQIADRNLCAIAKKQRDWLVADNDSSAQKLFRFLAYVNQSDWRARWLVKLVNAIRIESEVDSTIADAKRSFEDSNKRAQKNDKPPIPDSDMDALERISNISPRHVGVIEAADNWVIDILKDAARTPSSDEWNRLKASPLDGKIGMSFALQWRYNFGKLFGETERDEDVPLPTG